MKTIEQLEIIKKDMVEVWSYFRDYPEIKYKTDLPIRLFNKIKNHVHMCSLCTLFNNVRTEENKQCKKCPLKKRFYTGCYYYGGWANAGFLEDRSKWAGKMVKRIKKWKIKKEI